MIKPYYTGTVRDMTRKEHNRVRTDFIRDRWDFYREKGWTQKEILDMICPEVEELFGIGRETTRKIGGRYQPYHKDKP